VSDAAFRSSVLGCALAIAGCGNAACPDGFVQIEGSCVLPVDAPAPVDTGSGEDSGAADDAFVGIDAHVLETPDAFVPSDAGSDAPLPDAFLDIDGCTPSTFYVDNDGDGFGNVALSIASCEASVAGYSRDATDCDDDCNGCHPGGTETCDGRDNDCVGGVDDGVLLTFHADCDRDGYTAAGAPTVLSCTTPATGPAICPSGGWAGAASPTPDCNDACAVCFPGNPEVCDELDNNCDLSVDEGVRTTFVADCDGDTFTPTGATTIAACTMPSTPPSGCTTGAWRVGASGGVDCNDNCASCYPRRHGGLRRPRSGLRLGRRQRSAVDVLSRLRRRRVHPEPGDDDAGLYASEHPPARLRDRRMARQRHSSGHGRLPGHERNGLPRPIDVLHVTDLGPPSGDRLRLQLRRRRGGALSNGRRHVSGCHDHRGLRGRRVGRRDGVSVRGLGLSHVPILQPGQPAGGWDVHLPRQHELDATAVQVTDRHP
jgi:hypothetical protein